MVRHVSLTVGLSPSHMWVRSALYLWYDHVDPYKLTHRQLYVFDTYTNFAHNNARTQLASLFLNREFFPLSVINFGSLYHFTDVESENRARLGIEVSSDIWSRSSCLLVNTHRARWRLSNMRRETCGHVQLKLRRKYISNAHIYLLTPSSFFIRCAHISKFKLCNLWLIIWSTILKYYYRTNLI